MKSLIIFLITWCSSLFCLAQKIELKGNYQGTNLYIQNPSDGTETGFCTQKILVNGKEIPFENTSAFELRLDSLNYQTGDSLLIEIFHKPDCKPKVITSNAHPKRPFELVSISIDTLAVLHWTTKKEPAKFQYIVEQFRWNKWIKIGEVDAKGEIQENVYSFQTAPHSGKNLFRIKQLDYRNATTPSGSVEFQSMELNVKIITDPYKLGDELRFNKKTMFELYDKNGNVIRRGADNKIDLKGLEKGTYYLNYDNTMTDVIKFW
ncbi:MAG TPA: hypothetical protein VGC65_09190 [Bacteroidia bacterium]|jgi:hypothetical protein